MAENNNELFNSHQYTDLDTTLVDGTDALANEREMIISFFHVPSEKSIKFKAFITAYTESYNPDWATETVYGRADPIYLYKNTQRRISLTFKAVAASEGEAYENLGKIQQFIQFLYPTYIQTTYAQTISQSPLVRLKVMNLLQNMANQSTANVLSSNYAGTNNPEDLYIIYKSLGSEPDKGLLGWLGSVTINHNLPESSAGVFMKSNNTILPKFIEVTCDFNPIHEHPLGWEEEGETLSFAEKLFPYGVQLTDLSQIEEPSILGEPTPPSVEADASAQAPEPPPADTAAVADAAADNAAGALNDVLPSAADAAGDTDPSDGEIDTRQVTSTPILGTEVDWDVVDALGDMVDAAEAGD